MNVCVCALPDQCLRLAKLVIRDAVICRVSVPPFPSALLLLLALRRWRRSWRGGHTPVGRPVAAWRRVTPDPTAYAGVFVIFWGGGIWGRGRARRWRIVLLQKQVLSAAQQLGAAQSLVVHIILHVLQLLCFIIVHYRQDAAVMVLVLIMLFLRLALASLFLAVLQLW